MDKDKLTNHIKEIETKQSIKKVLGICEQSVNSHSVRNTKFLTPNQILLSEEILHQIPGISYSVTSLNEEAERRIIYFFPEYFSVEEIESVLSTVKISFLQKDSNIAHRDCLGSILSLGIERDNIGDILIDNDEAYVVVIKPLDIFLKSNLTKIKNVRVTADLVSEMPKHLMKFDEMVINVPSFRLDAIIAALTRLSREKAQRLIQQGDVKLNFVETKDKSRQLTLDSVLSIRGFGKYRVEELICETKKNRFRIKVLKYSN